MKWFILLVLYSEAGELLKKAKEFLQRVYEFQDIRHPTDGEKASIAAKCFELRLIWKTWNHPETNLPQIQRQQILRQIRRVKIDLDSIWEVERHLKTLTAKHVEDLVEDIKDLIWDLENGSL